MVWMISEIFEWCVRKVSGEERWLNGFWELDCTSSHNGPFSNWVMLSDPKVHINLTANGSRDFPQYKSLLQQSAGAKIH